ncbi:ATP-binding cassette domain-containing protein [Clostridium sp. OS1-26]|uniref:ATP-binding cassette domain-containing protein n=1 Tax=Clostridium sp. OS1-26 TaxID=3070681 RepID=UPI0027DFC06A|nr:ATP-binding cassette domain-containing protein [Clostridium sp. OS1-26]WML33704.1 ATP-binding cassette domain-containing protein [Clostridium sp. OS1-26]
MSVVNISNLVIRSKGRSIIDNINLSIESGEWFALIGESGSGKSITATSIGLLLPKDLELVSGEINIGGINIRDLGDEELRKIRGKEIAYIFQDYQNAFTPFIKIGKQIDEMIKCHVEMQKKKEQV